MSQNIREVMSEGLMNILYSCTRDRFTPDTLKELFASVRYAAALSSEELYRAIMASSHIVAAWDGALPVGLIRSMDDAIYCATIDLLLVRPAYQGNGIATELIRRLLKEIQTIRCISVSPSESRNNRLYTAFGFQVVEGAGLLQKENGAQLGSRAAI